MERIQGQVWKFGENVDTDAIVSGQYLDAPMKEAIGHVFENTKSGFARNVKKGDIIIAGENFGCGSSREQAPLALKTLGIGCIIAISFGRIFYRNAIAIGLPILLCKQAYNECEESETLSINLESAYIENCTKNNSYTAEPLPGEILDILEKGGMLALLKTKKGDI